MTRLPVPSFEAVLQQLELLVREHPSRCTPNAYAYDNGKPRDLVGHVLAASGVDLLPLRASRVASLWEGLFGPCWPWVAPESYLTMALLSHVEMRNNGGSTGLMWEDALVRGLKSFRRFLLSPVSGFLVQVSGAAYEPSEAHKALLQRVDSLTASALKRLVG